MSEFLKLEANAPATLGAVVEAITRLSTYPEAEFLELVSAGKIREAFPFRPTLATELAPDSVAENELIEASAMPLRPDRHAALIQPSLPHASSVDSPSRDRRKSN